MTRTEFKLKLAAVGGPVSPGPGGLLRVSLRLPGRVRLRAGRRVCSHSSCPLLSAPAGPCQWAAAAPARELPRPGIPPGPGSRRGPAPRLGVCPPAVSRRHMLQSRAGPASGSPEAPAHPSRRARAARQTWFLGLARPGPGPGGDRGGPRGGVREVRTEGGGKEGNGGGVDGWRARRGEERVRVSE